MLADLRFQEQTQTYENKTKKVPPDLNEVGKKQRTQKESRMKGKERESQRGGTYVAREDNPATETSIHSVKFLK